MDTIQEEERKKLFQRAIESVVNFDHRNRSGIGMQKEKSLHAVLKNYVDPDPAHQEVPVGPYIADIFQPQTGQIIEIQTANFGALSHKLSTFLPEHRVCVLYPIPHRKTVTWIDPKTGELLASHVSNFRGSFYELFRELSRIREFLGNPNLSIAALLIDMTEYRLQDGWGRDGKRGSHRFDRIPESIADELLLERAEDYSVFLPASPVLPEGFTSADFEKAVGIHRKKIQYSSILALLTQLGVVERIGMTRNRAWMYRILIPNETGRDFSRSAAGKNKK